MLNIVHNQGNLVYHYTSLDVFQKMVEKAEDGCIRFQASGLHCMNDSSEFIYGFKQFRRLLPFIESKIGTIPDEFKLSLEMEKADKILQGHWNEQFIKVLLKENLTPFVISTSAHKDSIPMWAMYGDSGRGVAIGLDLADISVPTKIFDGVIHMDWTGLNSKRNYALKIVSQPSLLHPAIALITSKYRDWVEKMNPMDIKLQDKKLCVLYNLCVLTCALVKHPAFNFENEWRILNFSDSQQQIKYKVNANGFLIPYIEVDIPISSFKRLILGPCNKGPCQKEMMKHLLYSKNISGCEVVVSKLPYRG